MEERQMTENNNRRKRNTLNVVLHFFQHAFFVAAAVLTAIVIMGSFVVISTKNGEVLRRVPVEEAGKTFEDSELFNQLFGNSVTDVICYGAIRAQMETEGKYDPQKVVDVTAFSGRYEGLKEEYITANYYLEDLLKWKMDGFEYKETHLTGEEVDDFLSRMRSVTKVDFTKGDFVGKTISYLNSDVQSNLNVEDVSGNIFDSEEDGSIRDAADVMLLNNRYLTVDGKKIENHVFSWEEYYALCDNVVKAAEDLSINYEEYQKYNDYYDADNSNVMYYILRTIGDKTQVYTNQSLKTADYKTLVGILKDECHKYMIYDPENMVYETNTLVEEETIRYVFNGYAYAYPEDTQILVGVKNDYSVADAYKQARNGFDNYSPYFWNYLTVAIVCGLLYLLLFVVLTIREGNVGRKESGEIIVRLKAEDKIPTEFMIILLAMFVTAIILLIRLLLMIFDVRALMTEQSLPVICGLMGLIISLGISFFYYSFVRRIKAGTLWKNSLLKRALNKVRNLILYLYDNSAIVLRVWIPFVAFVLLHFIVCFIMYTSEKTGLVLLGCLMIFVIDVAVGFFLYKAACGRQQIVQGIQIINDGDMEHKIDETQLHGDNLVLAQAVNNIGEGIREAVATSMKDERLKADLITNVSHDIKTPLTSIINYVDLIKRENVENPKVKEYIEVLDSKSQRLKQLTDDLVEASKISSGNIILNWEKINLVELLNQTIGEFSEKFEEKMLTPVFRTAKNSVLIEADSRRIWRVIENLFNNIFKYALTGTRVYIDLKEVQGKDNLKYVALSVMNISANPIKVNTDELTERFIRGDESRTTEGSGLGLSIAKNLTEVQKGKFDITVDGDLFKVTLTFPLLEQNV